MSDYSELSRERRRDRAALASGEVGRLGRELASTISEVERLKTENEALRMAIRSQVDGDLEDLRIRQMARIEEALVRAESWVRSCNVYFPALAERVTKGARELPSPGSQRFDVTVPYATSSRLTKEEMRAYVERFHAITSAAAETAARVGYFTHTSFVFELPPIAAQAADTSKKHITL